MVDATTADGLTQHGTLSTEGGTIGLIIEEGGFDNAGFTIEIEDSTQANASSTILIDNTGLFAPFDVVANAAGGDIVLSGTINADGADGSGGVDEEPTDFLSNILQSLNDSYDGDFSEGD